MNNKETYIKNMSHPNNIARDDYLAETYELDKAPFYRRDIFGQVWEARPAYERKLDKTRDQFQRTWLDEQRMLDGAVERFNEAFDTAFKSSKERNKVVEKLLNSF